MPIAATAYLPIVAKDPRHAVQDFLHLIRSNADPLNDVQVHLGLTCSSNGEVLLRLAGKLPLMALGFRIMPSDRARTAGEFRAQYLKGFCTFTGTLTEHLPADQACDLIEELLQSPPQAIRSTHFHIHAKRIPWKNAPPGSNGSLDLFDFKAFKRAARFSLSARMLLPGDDSKSPEIREILKSVSVATGVPFHKATISRISSEQERFSPARANTLLFGQICFDEAVEDTVVEIPARFISERARTAISPDQASYTRLQQWGTANSHRVNFTSLVKAAIKARLPGFIFDSSDGDGIFFKKPFSQRAETIVVFSKALPRLGKAFTLLLGIHAVDEAIRFDASIFRFEQTSEQKTWIYANSNEAMAALSEAIDLLQEVLPRFELALRTYFDPWPKELPAELQRQEHLTARQAFEAALPLARQRFPDAELIRIFNRCRSLQVRDIMGPELSIDGRLTQNSAWWLHFYSRVENTSFEILVPALGRIQLLNHGEQYRGENARRYLVSVGEEWIDSVQAFAIAEARGGGQQRASGKMWGVVAKLLCASGQAIWSLTYLLTDERGRNDFIIHLDAISGETVSDIRGL